MIFGIIHIVCMGSFTHDIDISKISWGNVCFHKKIWVVVLVFLVTMNMHYSGVIMSAMASQITGVSMVCSTVYSDADQRKHQSSASLVFVRGIQWWPVYSSHKGQVTRKMFPFDDVIMNVNVLDLADVDFFFMCAIKRHLYSDGNKVFTKETQGR